jgi:hypothetical protein
VWITGFETMARASKLTAPFLAATLLVASALPMQRAFAEEAAPNGTGANARATPTATVTPANDSSEVSIPSGPVDRKTAFRASTGGIVFHYGEGIDGIEGFARAITERKGVPVLALAGGPPNGVTLIVDRSIVPDPYTQHDIDDGTLGSDGIFFLQQSMSKKASLTTPAAVAVVADSRSPSP